MFNEYFRTIAGCMGTLHNRLMNNTALAAKTILSGINLVLRNQDILTTEQTVILFGITVCLFCAARLLSRLPE